MVFNAGMERKGGWGRIALPFNRQATDIKSGEPLADPTVQVMEFAHPPLERLHLGDQLAADLEVPALNREAIAASAQAYATSHKVHVFSHVDGIGDSIVSLRNAHAMALAEPGKTFTVYVRDELKPLSFNGLPPNVTILKIGDFDHTRIVPDESFLMTMSTLRDPLHALLTKKHHDYPDRDDLDRVRFSMEMPERALRKHVAWGPELHNIFRRSYPWLMNGEYSFGDAVEGVHPRLLGVDTQGAGLAKPLFDFSERRIDRDFDLVIAPDSYEGNVPDSQRVTRSPKAFTLQQWGEILSRLPNDMRVAIVRGKSHPEYTDVVFQIARKSMKNVRFAETPTLAQFTDLLLRTNNFLGMDTGTTHLAGEVSKALYQMGVNLPVREVFRILYWNHPGDYAIRGIPAGLGRVLTHDDGAYGTSNKPLGNARADRIAHYVMTGQ